jgi:hypothetical protein
MLMAQTFEAGENVSDLLGESWVGVGPEDYRILIRGIRRPYDVTVSIKIAYADKTQILKLGANVCALFNPHPRVTTAF